MQPVSDERPQERRPRDRADEQRDQDRGATAIFRAPGEFMTIERDPVDDGFDGRIDQFDEQDQEDGADQHHTFDGGDR